MSSELATINVPDHLWTPAEAAAALRVSKSWLYKAHRSGQLPGGIKLSKGILRFVPSILADHILGRDVNLGYEDLT